MQLLTQLEKWHVNIHGTPAGNLWFITNNGMPVFRPTYAPLCNYKITF